jgi:hypothetical protein
MTDGRAQVVQVNFTAIPSECVVVAAITNSFVHDCVVFDGNPSGAGCVDASAFKKLTFLDLKVDDAVLFVKTKSSDDPACG